MLTWRAHNVLVDACLYCVLFSPHIIPNQPFSAWKEPLLKPTMYIAFDFGDVNVYTIVMIFEVMV